MEKKALYNAMRIQCQKEAGDWRLIDWRKLTVDELFSGLMQLGIAMDRMNFALLSAEYETPEEMALAVASEMKLEGEKRDNLFLHLFELWRRLAPEKQTLSLFCDDLDYHISSYLKGDLEGSEALETDLATLQVMLEEKVDEGFEPIEVFATIQEHTASDLEAFLFNYIADQIDLGNSTYAMEVLEAFQDYISDSKWLVLLKVRLLMQSEPEEGSHLLESLLKETEKDEDVEFHLELLSLLIREGDHNQFRRKVQKIGKLVQTEEQFQELLHLMRDYYHDIDHIDQQERIEALLKKRSSIPVEQPVTLNDADIQEVLKQN